MKKRILAMLLSLAMIVTAFPATVFATEGEVTTVTKENATLLADEEEAEKVGINIAPEAEATAERSNPWITGAGPVNDGNTTNSWNSYGIEGEHPAEVTLTWDTARKINSMRVIFWADNNDQYSNAGVSFPKSCTAQYLAEDGETWVDITGMTNELGEVVDEVGVICETGSNNGLSGNNQYWNEVTFANTIETTAVRLWVDRYGTESNGVGIAEWEVYGMPQVVRGDNIATLATASAQYTNVYDIEEAKMNDGTLATNDPYTSWNSYGASDEYPLWVELDWGDKVYNIESLQVMWWADGGGVQFPSSVTLQYMNTRSGKWVDVKGFMDETGKATDTIGAKVGTADAASDVTGDYVNGANAYWNGIILEDTVKTSKLRMLVDRPEGSESYVGVGISEWEVFGTEAVAGAAENVAPNAEASASANNSYSGGPAAAIDGVLATSNGATTWNTWSGSGYPVSLTLTWDDPYELTSAKVMWWADVADGEEGSNGVAFPKSATIEYYDHDAGEWVALTGMTDETGATVDGLGVKIGTADAASDSKADYINDGNRYWNEVTFAQPVKTTQIRLLVDRYGSGSQGIGVGEFEVYGEKMDASWGELIAAGIEGATTIVEGGKVSYTGVSLPVGVDGATFAWSLGEGSEDFIAIDGASNEETVTIEALKSGKATLNLTVTCGESVRTASVELQIDGISGTEAYVTSTAAGVAPILPKKVVANGITFDDPTPSVSGRNGVDFGETFDAKLVDVTWEAVDPALYAEDQIGNTFEVKGTVEFGGKQIPATAQITVNSKVVTPVANSTVTFENVQLTDNFWLPKQEVNAVNSLNKAILEIEKPSGGEPNFVNAIAKLNGEDYSGHQGYVFQDSDIYKSIEAISYTLSVINDSEDPEMIAQKEKLEAKLEYWISLIEQVQYADGYLGTHFTLRSGSYAGGGGPGTHRWRYFANHEMYNAGHFYEAAVAYTRYREGIGDPDYSLYVVAKRSADQIVELFGPNGSRNEVPGHEEVELAMVKLAKLVEEYEGEGTGQKYLDTVQLLINRRGESGRDSGYQGGEYSQDNGSIKEVTEAVGHAVRACYFYAGVTDMATLLPEGNEDREAYLNTMDAIWDSVALTKTYITGGIGVASHGEEFGYAYELPSNNSYCEICAAIALANWNQRMNLVHEDAKYADVVERTLYNAILVGTNLEGNLFYYSTRLETSSGNGRSEWFGCACCPPNLMRTIAKLSEYMYTVHADDLFINMYIGSEGNVNIDGTNVGLIQTTEYPWDGAVKLEVNPAAAKEFTMNIRVPGWVADQYNKNVKIYVNDERVIAEAENGYIAVTRTWETGDVVMIDIPMEIRMTEADPNVITNEGKIALERGPIVYCMEKAGNAQINDDSNFNPLNFVIPRDADLTATYNPDLLNGVVEITGTVQYDNNGTLEEAQLQAVPYYAWNNRGDDGVQGQNRSTKMAIWTDATGEAPIKEYPLVAEYDMTVADGKLVDSVGDFDATLQNFAETDITAEGTDAVLVFDGTDNYVELPAGMILTEQFAIEATFKTSVAANSWLWSLGTKMGDWPNVTNYVFVSPNFRDSNSIRAGIKDAETELLFENPGSIALDTYTTIRMEFDKGEMKLLVDGDVVSTMSTDYSIQEIIEAGTTDGVVGFLGKSTYNPDPYFTGTLTEFKVYAVAPTDYSALQEVVDAEKAKDLDGTLYNADTWKAYTDALATAEAVLADPTATQGAVDSALKDLTEAIEELALKTKYTEANIAPFGIASADYTNNTGPTTGAMNDRVIAGSDSSLSWNSWGKYNYPLNVTITWDNAYTIDSMRVLWWADQGGVQYPSHAGLQYLNEAGEWVDITEMTTLEGEAVTAVPGDYDNLGQNGFSALWNEVIFEPVTATALRMVIEPNYSNSGVGISEWEIFEVYEPSGEVDKTELKELLDYLQTTDESKYTDASVQAVVEALKVAYPVYADENASQTEVNAAVARLQAAVNGLELKDEPTPGPGPVADILADFNFDAAPAEGEAFDGGNAVANGTYTLEAHGEGQALKLDGNGQFLTVTAKDGSSLLTGYDELTVSFQFNPESSATNWGFFAAADDSVQTYENEKYIGIFDNNGAIGAERYYSNAQARPANPSYSVGYGSWYHVTVVFTAATEETSAETILYVNGAEVAREASIVDISDLLGENSVAYIGKSTWLSTGEYYTGLIDNYKIYGRALTAEEIAAEAAKYLDKSALETAIADAEKVEQGNYTPGTWADFQAALAAAKEVLAKEDATQTEINDAVSALTDAQSDLREKADMTALAAAVEEAEKLDPAAYTAETWEKVAKEIADAKEVLANVEARQNAVDSALRQLNNAIADLEFVDGLPYVDVTEDDWFYSSVAYNYYAKTMTGLDETHFGPYESLSRAQFALILYRIEGEPEVQTEKSFLDISGDEWYGKAVLWAAEAGIVTGYENGCYGPVDMITREQMAVMMYRYAKYLEKDVTTTGDLSKFNDVASVSPFATEAMSWANGMGIITGKEEGTMLAPQANTARAEAAAIIQRFMDAYAE